MKEQLATLVPGRDQLVFGSSSSKFGLLQDTASSVKKVLSFYGDRQPFVC